MVEYTILCTLSCSCYYCQLGISFRKTCNYKTLEISIIVKVQYYFAPFIANSKNKQIRNFEQSVRKEIYLPSTLILLLKS